MKRKGLKIEERGRVTAVSNPLIKIEGLPLAKAGEILEIGGKKAMVFQFGKQIQQGLPHLSRHCLRTLA